MSNVPLVRSGPNRPWPKYGSSSAGTSVAARYFRSILKQAEIRLRGLALHPDRILLSLFQSMTPVQRQAAIGRLRKLNDHAGDLYVRCLRIQKYLNCSKTASMTSPLYFERWESGSLGLPMTQCSSTTHSNPRALKASASSVPSTPTMGRGRLSERELTLLKETSDE